MNRAFITVVGYMFTVYLIAFITVLLFFLLLWWQVSQPWSQHL